MKNRLTLTCLSCAVVAASVPAFAANSDSGVVSINGKIVAALNITNTTAMTMPDLVGPSGVTPQTGVIMTCDDSGVPTLSYTPGANPFANGVAAAATVSSSSANVLAGVGNSSPTCGTVTITGEPDFSYVTTLAKTLTDSQDVPGLKLGSVFCTNASGTSRAYTGAPSITATLDSGTDTLYCGAQVYATNTTGVVVAAGAYDDLSITVTVVYD